MVLSKEQQKKDAEMQKNLDEDAVWKRIQQNTFLRWVNQHLSQVDKTIASLETDFADGIRFIALLEVLSGKKCPYKFSKRPTVRGQKLENVYVGLKFLTDDEGLKLVNIDSSDIVDCKLKLILGLIWTLILHYSISLPMWEGDDENLLEGKAKTPKDRLLKWIQSKIPDKAVKNFTKDWNDGTTLGALVDALAPGLCPNWQKWDPNDKVRNIKEAMDAAEKWLGVAPLIDPDNMANPKVDELSMMTYLSQFPNAKLKEAAPLKLETNPKKVRCFGPGIEPKGVTCGAPTTFTIETFGAGEGDLEAWVEDEKGNKTKVDIKLEDEGKKRWKASYTPKTQGAHKVFVKFAGQDVPKAPFAVNIEGTPGNPNKCVASGPGIEPKGRPAGKLTHFEVKTTGAGFGQVECVITDPEGKTTGVPMKLTKVADDLYKCEYCPVKPGPHVVQVLFAGKPIPKAPFKVNVGMPCNPRRVKASGRGLQKKGVRVGDVADFKVLTTDAGDGNVEVEVTDPDGKPLPVEIKQTKDDRYDVSYKPVKEGPHKVVVKYGGDEIPKSPYEVGVGPFKESKIVAYGPGLKGGVTEKPAKFVVDTNGETGSLSFTIEGPSKCSIQCEDLGDGSAGVTYTPSAPGDYVIHILCDGEDIPKSPYVATIEPEMEFDLTKVKAFGPGLSPGVQQDKQVEFTVDCKAATAKPESDPNVSVEIHNENYEPIPVTVKSNKNGTVTCSYKPKDDGKYTVCVNYNGCAIPDSPFKVDVTASADPLKVKVYGPGVEKGVKSSTPTKFFIDCKNAGSAKPKVKMTNEDDDEVKVKMTDNKDGTYTCEYKTPTPGNHFITVEQGGKPVPGSPFKVPVEPHMSTKDVIVSGLQPVVFTNAINEFQVDTSKLPKPDDHKVECTIVKPDGTRQLAKVESKGNGKFKVTHIPKEVGACEYKVTVDGIPVPDSPFPVKVESGCDPSRVKVYGPGIEFGKVNEENTFTVETKGAGTGGLGLSVEGPTEAKMTCVDNRDGTCTVTYVPDTEGVYRIGVKFAGQDVPGSVFEVPAAKSLDVSKVTCSGPGLEEGKVRAGVPQNFTVDTKAAAGGGKLPVSATVTSSDGSACPVEVTDIGDGKFSVDYIAPEDEKATCKIQVKAAGKEVPKSPFSLKLKPKAEPSNIKMVGAPPKEVPCSIPQEFVIDTTEAGAGKLDVEVVSPAGEVRPAKTRMLPDGKTKVLFVCDTPGKNKIVTKYDDKEVKQCSFQVDAKKVGDHTKCILDENSIPKAVAVGKDYEVKVDTRNAGEGRLTGSITKAGSKTKSVTDCSEVDTIVNKDGTQSVRFKVKEKGEYNFDLRFGGEKITKTTKIVTTQEVYEESTTTTSYRKETKTIKKFRDLQLTNLPTRHKNSADVDAFVKMPSGGIDRPVIVDNQDGTVSIRYDPREEGCHELHVKFNGEHIQGSPFKFNVDSISSGYVTAYGPGLVHGIANEPTQFHISTKGAASGGLNVAVEGPSKADINYHDNRDGTVTVTYLPAAPGDYKITIKFADEHIKGSPFIAKVTGEGRKRAQISVGHSSEVSLKVQEKDIKTLNAYIVAPNGLEEPCFLKQLPNGQLGITFTPRLTGDHRIHVRRQGQEITGSPFKISVLDCEIGDSTRVQTSGAGLIQGVTQKANEFVINTKDAGYGGLSISMEGPSKADIKVKDNEDGTVKVNYVPTEPGYYILNVKFADHHVRGSPFTIKVDGEGSNVQRERIKKQREAAPISEVGQECKLIFKLPNACSLDMDAKVQGPGGDTNPACIRDSDDDAYEVGFVPKVAGVHTVTVRHKKFHIPGSPFQFTVGPLRDFGAHRVHAGGQGLERGIADEPCEFNIWTREAGAGALAVSVEGPSKAAIDFKDRKDGSCYITYKVADPGEYRVGIKFNDQHIPDSPFKVYVMPPAGDAAQIELANVPDTIKVNSPVNLSLRMNGAKGTLDGEVVDPSGKKDDCFMCCLDSEEWALRFLPKENGVHHIHIRCDGVHIPQSPFRVLVGTDDADPAAVNAHGPGLKEAIAGQKTDFVVDTTAAGIGKLKVQVDGPTKVSMDCTEIDEGYKVHYTPLAPGDYFIAVKYNGYHVCGSPFKVTCSGEATRTSAGGLVAANVAESSNVELDTVRKQGTAKADRLPAFKSDAKRATSKGLGLKKAVMGRANTFTVDCSNAGNNMLYCSVFGPKGPCDETFVKHMGRNMYNVTYQCKERGDHIIMVKWGDENIPGSPFKVISA